MNEKLESTGARSGRSALDWARSEKQTSAEVSVDRSSCMRSSCVFEKKNGQSQVDFFCLRKRICRYLLRKRNAHEEKTLLPRFGKDVQQTDKDVITTRFRLSDWAKK